MATELAIIATLSARTPKPQMQHVMMYPRLLQRLIASWSCMRAEVKNLRLRLPTGFAIMGNGKAAV